MANLTRSEILEFLKSALERTIDEAESDKDILLSNYAYLRGVVETLVYTGDK